MKFNFENLGKKIDKNKKAIMVGAMMATAVGATASGPSLEKETTDKPKIEKGHTKEFVADSVDIASFCKTGTTEFVNMKMREAAKNAVREFLKDVDFNKYSIKIVGKYSIERPWEGNEQLKEDRRILGEQIVGEVLRERFSEQDIKNIEINSSAIGQSIYELGYSKEEIEKMPQGIIESLIDKTQGIDISIERKQEISVSQVVEKINQEYKDVYAVIVDQSKSMENEARDVANIVNSVNRNENRDIKIINLEGGNTESHLKTLIKVLENINNPDLGQKEILILTDEPDNSVSSEDEYNQLVQKALSIASLKGVEPKMQVFNPVGKTHGDSKIIYLSSNPKALYLNSKFKKGNSPGSYWESKLKEWYTSL